MAGIGKRIDPEESINHIKPGSSGDSPAGKASDDTPPPVTTTASFEPRSPKYRLDNVILPDATRHQVEILQSRLKHHQILYDDWGLANIDPQGIHAAVNFYGPPGTGKTMLVEALAAEMGRSIIDVSYAEIESKYVGETGKNIRLAFRRAAETDSILFFDEADSILGKRMTSVSQAADHAVNVARAVMLKELDAFQGIIMFATNLAKNFDGAFVRRILQHVELPPPDEAGRARLWEIMVPVSVPGRDALDWNTLAKASDGLCGGDIKNAVILGLSHAVAREGSQRKVLTNDLTEAILSVRQSKKDIGSSHVMAQWGDASPEEVNRFKGDA